MKVASTKSVSTKPHIVVLGAGFGGLYTVKELLWYFKNEEVDITIVNQTNYFLFTPMLHEVATGSVGHHQVVESLRELLYRTTVKLVVSEVGSIDLAKKTVSTKQGLINFDYLVVALGSTTNFYGVPGADKYTLTLKDLRNAITLRARIIESFEKAANTTDKVKRKELLTFGVIGGGPTGVELVAEMAELFWDNMINLYPNVFKPSEIRLYLFSQAPELLTQLHQSLRQEALRVLKDRGIDVHLASTIIEVKKDGVMLAGKTFIKMGTIIWTAGTTPNTPKFKQEVALDPGRRLMANNFLQMTGWANVYTLGDVASVIDSKSGKPLPMLAQVAVRQADTVAYNLAEEIRGTKNFQSFKYRSMGSLVSLGQWNAVAEMMFLRFSGRVAWYLWRTIYLFKFISWEKRFKIALDWTLGIFSYRDITKA
jgi:NADH dehydrogenase